MSSKYSSLTIDLPSLDPPGTKRKLHRPFALTNPRPRYDQVAGYLRAAEPFDVLPRTLIPTRRITFKPPIMHYGWMAPQDFLLDYARSHKLTRQWGRKLIDAECIIRAVETIGKKCRGKVDDDGLVSLQITLIGPDREREKAVISIYTNFDLNRRNLPSEDTIERLRQAFGLEEPPKWYLDRFSWRWSYW
ncbi:hypothetical protein DAEQUDRAFT_733660 [Daedalea quercina L-15889]|uniref:Uncharacterized protein n=1 Tax=Daedalea quercina L-15889 TaxID=1314783 RepID=A0A165KUA7_9APHY|nr:hypothetical protein DAEQUDRAFT_733660 [Daedalea quercina L-15889]